MKNVYPEKILIVEDEAFLRDLYVDTLTPEGYQIETAVDGDEALDKIKRGGWDLILLDIILPKKSAFEVLDTLNLDSQFKQSAPPIIFLTNLDSDGDIKKALSLGGSGYLIKSQITPGDLIHEVKMYLAKANTPKSVQNA